MGMDVLAARRTLQDDVYSLVRIALDDAFYLITAEDPCLADSFSPQCAFNHVLGHTLVRITWRCPGCSAHFAG